LIDQTLAEDGPELNDLRKYRSDVEKLLRKKKKIGNAPSIRYAGSYKKGTMIKESYDLDITCWWCRLKK